MYKPEDIIIVGDSFCLSREQPEDWPVHLTKLLTGEAIVPRGRGHGGCAWWSTRKCLLNELSQKPAKVLIICHTELSRLWSNEDRPLNSMSVQNYKQLLPEVDGSSRSSKELADAGNAYYKYLFSTEFHEWAAKAWYKELDALVVFHNIEKVIHLHCFPEYMCGSENRYVFKNGINVSNVLFNYQDLSVKHFARNHFDINLNLKLAEELYRVISSNTDNTTTALNL